MTVTLPDGTTGRVVGRDASHYLVITKKSPIVCGVPLPIMVRQEQAERDAWEVIRSLIGTVDAPPDWAESH